MLGYLSNHICGQINNLQYHLGEKVKFQIRYTTNVDDYIIKKRKIQI